VSSAQRVTGGTVAERIDDDSRRPKQLPVSGKQVPNGRLFFWVAAAFKGTLDADAIHDVVRVRDQKIHKVGKIKRCNEATPRSRIAKEQEPVGMICAEN